MVGLGMELNEINEWHVPPWPLRLRGRFMYDYDDLMSHACYGLWIMGGCFCFLEWTILRMGRILGRNKWLYMSGTTGQ